VVDRDLVTRKLAMIVDDLRAVTPIRSEAARRISRQRDRRDPD
jgi:hypothetical protein